jgi:TRAP-type C4-dicarboxylate transport system permease small subunit
MKMTMTKLIAKQLSLRRVTLVLFAVAVIAVPVSACAQSCALCYTQAASSGRQMIEALRSGILILVIPPTLGTIAFLFLVRHRRNQTRRAEPDGPRLDW